MTSPYYSTPLGEAFLGDAKEVLPSIRPGSVNLVVTSPPYALKRKKDYGNVDDDKYVDWFLEFAALIYDVLAEDGSLVIVIGGTWNRGEPTRSVYHFELLLKLCQTYKLAQEFFWYNPARLPSPAEWVTVRRIRVKDAVDYVWWLSKGSNPKANNRNVLRPYSESMMELLEKGYRPKLRPSGHDISAKFNYNRGGAIPPNLLQIANTESNSRYLVSCRRANLPPNPARFPIELPKFFIEFLTDPGDLVLDPFAGSNVTSEAAEMLGRRWTGIEIQEVYLQGSMFRFNSIVATQWSRYAEVAELVSKAPEPEDLESAAQDFTTEEDILGTDQPSLFSLSREQSEDYAVLPGFDDSRNS